MPESSIGMKESLCGSPRYRLSPLRHSSRASSLLSLPLPRNPYGMNTPFCTEENVPECLQYINQELSSLGLPTMCCGVEEDLNVVVLLNSVYNLLELHQRGMRAVERLELEQLKTNSNMDYLQINNTRLKDQLERCQRENTGLGERERQLQLKVKSLQSCIKNEKEEVQKLQNIISSRATQYNHDMKRKEREFNKLKERLNQLLIHKKEKRQASTIELLNYVGRSDGRRSLWKTEKTEARHEGKMYKTLLNDYDTRQKDLLTENAELRKVLQQMKKEMVSILSPRTQTQRDDRQKDTEQDEELEEEVFDSRESSRGSIELSCDYAREKLTNSIRLQWRRLKSHVERLDSQASLLGERANMAAIPRASQEEESNEEEMTRLKQEVQQCRDFIHTQQQLLQQQLSSPCDEETASLLTDCYLLEEKERLKENWRAFNDQRMNFETERRNFTEAAIRLSHERKAFEEDRASWLKHQFLNLTPFSDQKKPQMSKSQSASSVYIDPVVRPDSTPAKMNNSSSTTARSPADLYPNLRLIPESKITAHPNREGLLRLGPSLNRDIPSQLRHLNGGEDSLANGGEDYSPANRDEDNSSYSFTGERNDSI